MTKGGFWSPVSRRLAYASTLSVVIFLSNHRDILSNTYDASTHMMFGSHYLIDWWSSVDNRWYLGFEVTSYPPLAHQLLAVISAPIHYFTSYSMHASLKIAYLSVLCILTLAFPYAIFRFSELFTSRRAAANAAVVSAAFSGWWTSVAVYGQYPNILAILFTLFGAVFLHRYLTQPSVSTGAMTIFLTSLVPLTHHFSTISIFLATYAVVLVDTTRNKQDLKTNIRRGLPIAIISIIIVVIALRPFVEFLLTSPSQPTIPHSSRLSWFEGSVLNRTQFDYTVWAGGILLVAIPAVIGTAKRDRSLLTLVAFSLLFGVLSLGQTTPLPSLLYGGLSETLTYFRFATWGGVLLLPVLGDGIDRQLPTDLRKLRIPQLLNVVVIITIICGSLITATALISPPSESQTESVTEIGSFMESDEHWKWRYLALGMPTKLGNLGMEAPHAQTIDGYYNTGRSSEKLPRLFYSGIGQLSSARESDVLGYYLQNHHEYHIRFIFSADPRYEDSLRDAGFELLYDWSHINIRVWYDPEVEPFADATPPPVEGHTGYAWGTVPMACLAGAIALRGSAIALRGKMIASESDLRSFSLGDAGDGNAVQRMQKWNHRPALLVLLLVALSAIAAGAGPGPVHGEAQTTVNPEDSRVVYYDFDDNSSQIQNRANSRYDGSARWGAEYVPREGGRAVHFKGRPAHVKVDNSSLLSTGSPIAIEFMVKLEQRQDANILGNYGSYWFWVSGNRIRFAVMSDGERIAEPSAEIPIGEWTRVVGTYDADNGARIFVGGKLIDSEQTATEQLDQDEGDLTINMGGWEDGLYGSVDEFSVWNRSYSETEVRMLQRTQETSAPNSPRFRLGLTLFVFLLIIGVSINE